MTDNDGHEFVFGNIGSIGVEDVCRRNRGSGKHGHTCGEATGATGTRRSSVFGGVGGAVMGGGSRDRSVVGAFNEEGDCPTIALGWEMGTFFWRWDDTHGFAG